MLTEDRRILGQKQIFHKCISVASIFDKGRDKCRIHFDKTSLNWPVNADYLCFQFILQEERKLRFRTLIIRELTGGDISDV